MTVPIGVVGAGVFGRAIATAVARNGHSALVWSREHRPLGKNIRTTQDFAEFAETTLVFVTVPSTFVTEVAREIGPHLDGSHFLVHVSRGLVGPDLRTLTQILRTETPVRQVGALAGPLVAASLERGEPGGAIVGSAFPDVTEHVRRAIGGHGMLVYSTSDTLGVEISSAMVGLLALGAGYGVAHGLGPSSLAVFATRGMLEAARVGRSLGAQEETFGGLAGFGDLIAALARDGRPEFQLGEQLGRGVPLKEACQQVGAHIEGVRIARRVANHAERRALEVPILTVLADVIDGKLTASDAIALLVQRREQDRR